MQPPKTITASHLPASHLFQESDLPLLQLTHSFVQAAIWLENGMAKQIATYDLFVRDMPLNRSYMMAAGLEEMLTWLQKLRFSEDDIAYLKKGGLLSKAMERYLRTFRFTGEVWAMPEGTVFFPYEPVVRITAPLIEAMLIEIYLMSALASNVPFLTKACRLKLATQGKFGLAVGCFRAHSFESGAKAARAGFLCGMSPDGNPAISKKYNLPVPPYFVNAQHLFISSYPNELAAFRAIADHYPQGCSFMVDTYHFKQGIANAITVAGELRERGYELASILIDSGHIPSRVRYARQQLDVAGFSNVRINVAGNNDEHRLQEYVEQNVPINRAVVVTELVTLPDSPKLEVVYKIAELRTEREIKYTAKLTPGKVSYPGRKQVFRTCDAEGKMSADTIGLEDEQLGEPLLMLVMKDGKLQRPLPSLEDIRQHIDDQLACLPEYLVDLNSKRVYPALASERAQQLLTELRSTHIQQDLGEDIP